VIAVWELILGFLVVTTLLLGLLSKDFHSILVSLEQGESIHVQLHYIFLTPFSRWYSNHFLDVSAMPEITYNGHSSSTQRFDLNLESRPLVVFSNPLQSVRGITPPPRTQTLPQREVYHQAHAAVKPLLAHIQTENDMINFHTAMNRVL